MKILLITHSFSPNIGGIESISEMLAQSFFEAGHQVKVLTWTSLGSVEKFPFLVIRQPSFVKLFRLHAWAELVFENNPSLRLSWPSLILNKKSVVGLQTWIKNPKRKLDIQAWLKKQWLKRASAVIACSECIKQVCWPNAVVVGNPYNDRLFTKLGQQQPNNNIVFVGRLVSDKGADVILEAFAKLKKTKNFTSSTLTIVGEGPEENNLLESAKQLDINEHVFFLGAKRGVELVKLLNRHRFLVVPSRWKEPFGIVALEGMACGCLPIVSEDGGLKDAIGDAGFTFTTGNADSLVLKFEEICLDEMVERRARFNAPKHLLQHTAGVVAKKYLEIFESVN